MRLRSGNPKTRLRYWKLLFCGFGFGLFCFETVVLRLRFDNTCVELWRHHNLVEAPHEIVKLWCHHGLSCVVMCWIVVAPHEMCCFVSCVLNCVGNWPLNCAGNSAGNCQSNCAGANPKQPKTRRAIQRAIQLKIPAKQREKTSRKAPQNIRA